MDMDKNSTGVTTARTRYVKIATRRRKRFVFLMIALVLLGWFAYNNVSLPSDWVLYKTLLREAEKHPGKTFRLKLKGIYPGEWQKVCFYANYQGREEILRDSGIDIQPTRARVWAGSESAMTFLFIDADGTIHAQRIREGREFNSQGNGIIRAQRIREGKVLNGGFLESSPSCGNRDSVVEIEANVGKGGHPYSLIFYPLGR